MHPRQRNGTGYSYRSNPMGIGNASRISLEGSMRGHRMYNSEYRNYNRGGYGPPKQFQLPPPLPPPPRETDIFVEAGKLAAQYLVSKGVLPSNALSGKWQNDGVENLIGEFRAFRQHELENAQIHVPGHVSAHDVESGKRKYGDEYDLIGGRSFPRGVVRSESLKYYGSERKKELGKSGSWAGRSRADTNVSSENVSKDCTGGDQKSLPGEMTLESGNSVHVGTELEKCNSPEDASAKESSANEIVDANMSDAVSKVGEEGENDNVMEQKNNKNKEGSLVSEEDVDLVEHSKFENVPTKTCSSLTNKGSKSDQDLVNKEENNFEKEVSEVHAMDVDIVNSSDKNEELKFLMSDVTIAAPLEKEPVVAITEKQELDDRLSGFGSINSMFMEKGGKRTIDDDTDCKEDIKKLKEWVSPSNAEFYESMENQETVNSKTVYVTLSDDDQSVSLFPTYCNDSCDFMKEKQLFPGLFKTCDLNLVGASHEVNEKHGVAKMVNALPSVAETGKEGAAVDVDLSMSNNNGNMDSKNGSAAVNYNHIEIIDLEDESLQEDNGSQRRGDITFSDLDAFHNSVNSGNEITDIQDGYGLMISELLGNESPNSSSVASGLNSLHNHMVLPNGEGILGDDDSIYMSLGEIPISLLAAWEQPSQDYGKPF